MYATLPHAKHGQGQLTRSRPSPQRGGTRSLDPPVGNPASPSDSERGPCLFRSLFCPSRYYFSPSPSHFPDVVQHRGMSSPFCMFWRFPVTCTSSTVAHRLSCLHRAL